MNILVTGANGQLGREVQRIGSIMPNNYIFTDIDELDITNRNGVMEFVNANKIDIIINCAAYTNVEQAESNPDLAELLNATAVANLAAAAKSVDATLFHISTDYVFGKEPYNVPCTEEQKGTPTGVYGLTKLHGEQRIAQTGCNHAIIRTAWLYSEFGKNFCRTMMSLTSTKPSLKVVFDQVGTPTYALDLAKAVLAVIDDFSNFASEYGYEANARANYPKNGIYHYSNEGVCSWYDFAKSIAQYNGTTECNIEPCHSDEFPSPVKRPNYSVLDKTKIKEVFGVEVPYWRDSLKICISNLKASVK